jgi:hypothetical protein
MDPMPRRRFLWSGLAVATLGGTLLSACGGDDDDDAAAVGAEGVTGDEQAQLPLVVLVASADLAVGANRFAFAVVDKASNQRLDPSVPVQVGFSPPVAAGATRIPLAASFVAAPYHGDGLDTKDEAGGTDIHGVYVVDASFDVPGPDATPWYVWAKAGDQVGVSPIAVNAAAKVLDVGAPAPRSASPTDAAPMGVDPICTRSPACGLHSVSLADVIGTKPVVVSFSTPARCTSRLCGPTLDMVVEQAAGYQDRVQFVHVEIYQNNSTTDLIQTVSDWALPTEPWVFAIGKDGTIVARLDSAFDRSEITALIEKAAATA